MAAAFLFGHSAQLLGASSPWSTRSLSARRTRLELQQKPQPRAALPALPPWTPSTPEESFSHHGERVRARARAAEEARAIASVECDGHALFAEVVQTGIKGGRAWIRPLALFDEEANAWLDVRGCADIFLPEDCLNPSPDADARTRVAMTVAAFTPNASQSDGNEENTEGTEVTMLPHEIREAPRLVSDFVTRVVQGFDIEGT
jgi:hypothetical protein